MSNSKRTNQQMSEDELQRETLLSILGQLQDGVILVSLQKEVIYMNNFARKIYGFTGNAKYKLSLEDYDNKFPMYYSRSRRRIPLTQRPAMRSLETKKSQDTVLVLDTKSNLRFKNRKIGLKIVHYRTTMIKKGDGKPMLLLVLLRDITKERSMLNERKELLQLNRAKDEFISLSSHQLRTPATAVKQFIGMVLEGYAGQIKRSQRDMLEHAYNSNERQLHVISDLLKVAQVDAGKVKLVLETCNIVDLIGDILNEQQKQFEERSQTVSFKTDQINIPATIDISRMRMVFENLIDNATKYTPEGKKITISIEVKNKKIQVYIADEGVGIAKEDIGKLFQKFSRLDNPLSIEVGGTGIGLYWVKKIVNLHNGAIEVESEPNKGTTFTLTIPA